MTPFEKTYRQKLQERGIISADSTEAPVADSKPVAVEGTEVTCPECGHQFVVDYQTSPTTSETGDNDDVADDEPAIKHDDKANRLAKSLNEEAQKQPSPEFMKSFLEQRALRMRDNTEQVAGLTAALENARKKK